MAFRVKSRDRYVQQFHCGNSKPLFISADSIDWFHADGDELEMVRQQFSGIPITRSDTCTWSGDLAQFVFRNLVL